MLYTIKNVTGNPASPDSRLWEGKTLYATSDRYQAVLPIAPQKTATVGAHAMTELTSNFPLYVSVISAGTDFDVPYRLKITLSHAWQLIDLGSYSGCLTITNPEATGGALLQFSFSDFAPPAVAPPDLTISDVLPGETIPINDPLSPLRFVYIKGNGTTAYIMTV